MPEQITAPTSNVAMDFGQAVHEAVLYRKKVKRLEWDLGFYMCFMDGTLKIFEPDNGMLHNLILSESDALAEDWVTIE